MRTNDLRRRAGGLGLLGLLLLASSCEKHARLRITSDAGDVSAQVTRLLALFRHEAKISTDDKVTSARLTEPLSPEDGLAIDSALRRVSGFTAAPMRAAFELALTDAGASNPVRKRTFPLTLRTKEGMSQLKALHRPTMVGEGQETCSYDVPLDASVPSLPYGPDFEIHVLDPDLADMVGKIAFADRGTMTFVFSEKDSVGENFLNLAGQGEFSACARQILDAGQAFDARVVLPDLVGRIQSYELDDTYF